MSRRKRIAEKSSSATEATALTPRDLQCRYDPTSSLTGMGVDLDNAQTIRWADATVNRLGRNANGYVRARPKTGTGSHYTPAPKRRKSRPGSETEQLEITLPSGRMWKGTHSADIDCMFVLRLDDKEQCTVLPLGEWFRLRPQREHPEEGSYDLDAIEAQLKAHQNQTHRLLQSTGEAPEHRRIIVGDEQDTEETLTDAVVIPVIERERTVPEWITERTPLASRQCTQSPNRPAKAPC